MSRGFHQKWEEQPQGLKEALRPAKPLKPQIHGAVNRVETQLSRINGYIEQYASREKTIFDKIVQAYEHHDKARANMYANELVEVKKQKAILIHSRLALDNATLRLRTIFEFGNVASVLTSAVDTIQSVKNGLTGIMPEVSNELSSVETCLSDIMFEMGQTSDSSINFNASSEESEKILREAAIIAETRMNSKFPEMLQEPSESGGHLIIKKDADTKDQ